MFDRGIDPRDDGEGDEHAVGESRDEGQRQRLRHDPVRLAGGVRVNGELVGKYRPGEDGREPGEDDEARDDPNR